LLSFDDRLARIVGWVAFECAGALLHEAIDAETDDCGVPPAVTH